MISIHLPPLREIKDDIPYLVQHFMKKFSRDTSRQVTRLAPDALDLLMRYNWPGNVRQLENIIERAFALGEGDMISVNDLPSEIRDMDRLSTIDDACLNLVENEKVLIKRALRQAKGNKAEAAQLLGINITTVYRKMEKYRLSDFA